MSESGDAEDFIRCRLTPAERRRIEPVGRQWGPDVYHGPEYLLGRWRRLVEEVERPGYSWEMEDYWLELWYRDALEDVIGMVAPGRQEPIREVVRPIDLRFDAATVELAKPIVGDPPQRWWLYRIPRDPHPEFLEGSEWRVHYEQSS